MYLGLVIEKMINIEGYFLNSKYDFVVELDKLTCNLKFLFVRM